MSPRNRHPNKDVQKALEEAEDEGAELELRGKKGHAWGRLYCGRGGQRPCCLLVWSTPKSPHALAKDIRSFMRKCPHKPEEADIADRNAEPAKVTTDDRNRPA